MIAQLVRERAASVVAGARHVRIRSDRLESYAASLGDPAPYPPPAVELPDDPEERARMALTIDAVNFGSGWFPTLRKRDGRSGFFTIALGLAEAEPWPLADTTPEQVAAATGQDPGHELMAIYAAHLRELGRQAAGDGYLALARRPGLAEHLATWPTFADPFYKRAQLTAYDMVCAGLVPPGHEGDLTMFADNLVPHVLRLDGVLEYAPALLARIEAGGLLEHGSPEETEIRACGLHAVDLMARDGLTAPAIDNLLWSRGQEPRYKSAPRHRARCTAY